jgi:TolB-like protein/DNA-binding winged helix-turn-helix (wHTH) protein/Flp pilus assembly protein TadD
MPSVSAADQLIEALSLPQIYRFGDFELNLDAQQLKKGATAIPLERRPFDLLAMLVSNRDRLVSREEIIATLWPKKVIIDFESGINTLVRKVRHALGDSADEPRYIDTIPGRGYRFVAEVSVQEPAGSVSQPSVAIRPGRRMTLLAGASLLVVLVAAGILVTSHIINGGPAQTRIAIFPFENLTGNPDLGYLASGLAEETGTSLAGIDPDALAVIGMVSSRALARSDMPLARMGREFDVDYVVTSSLRLDRSTLRVSSQLVRVTDSQQLWSATFDRELTNVLGLQREISIAIAEQVRLSLSPDVAAAIDHRQTRNPAAYGLYLKGRYEWMQLTPASIRRAVDYYRQAVALDADYSLAWAGIAHALATAPMAADAEPELMVQTVRDALERALESGSDLTEVQYAEGYFEFFIRWDWVAAELAAREAVALDPNSGIAHMLLGMVLSQTGQDLEAREMLKRARELEPLFPLTFANSAYVETAAGTPADGIEFARQAIAINPEFWVGYYQLGNTLVALNQLDAALEAFTQAVRFSASNSGPVSERAFVLARLGREDEAREVLDELTLLSTNQYVPPYSFAIIHAGLGEFDEAFEWLERSLAVHDVHLMGLPAGASVSVLRDDPRFDSIMERGGLRRQSAGL